MKVIWHDLECGSYHEDLPVWRALAEQYGSPVLDVGAGSGRVTLDLARRGYAVTALDLDRDLLAALAQRAAGATVETVVADAREFELGRTFALCLVPMQTVQLLGGSADRRRFLACARRHLSSGGALAIAISPELEPFELTADAASVLPDVTERDGVVYSSQPTAVRATPDGFVLERRREVVHPDGHRTVEQDRVQLDRVTVEDLRSEGRETGLQTLEVRRVPATRDYVGSDVVVLGA